MPYPKLTGLPGLNRLDKQEEANRRKYLSSKAGAFAQYANNPYLQSYLEDLSYNNYKFKQTFGEDKFKSLSDGTMHGASLRNDLLDYADYNKRAKIVNNEFAKRYKPQFNNFDWNKYNEMSPEGKLSLMKSAYVPNKEFEKKWEEEGNAYNRSLKNVTDNPYNDVLGVGITINAFQSNHSEAVKQDRTEKNQKILDRIYNDDLKSRTQKLDREVSDAYYQNTDSEDAVRKRFNDTFIKDDSPMVKMKKGEYAAHINSQEMENFSIDDMRKALAKWDTYTKYMSQYAAGTALNNEAQEYIADHQSGWERAKGYIGDFAISTMSYTADKVNGFVNAGYGFADAVDKGVMVYVDKDGNPLDPKDVHTNNKGQKYYLGADGKAHSARQRRMARTTLRNMGKDLDGSENHGLLWDGDIVTLNPQYWTRAEMYGTLNEEEQKQLEKYNASPHTVAYNPNEQGNFWWEVFKMGTFGLADMATSLLPIGWGFGLVGKGFGALSKISKTTNFFSRAMNASGRFLMNNSQRIAQLSQGTAGALGIAYAYNRGAFQETLEKNLGSAESALQERSQRAVYDRYNSNKQYKANIDNQIEQRFKVLKTQAEAQNKENKTVIFDQKAFDEQLRAQAQREVIEGAVEVEKEQRKNSPEYTQLQDKAIDEAGDAAFNTFWPEAIKYGLVNTVGFRKWLYTNPTGLRTKLSSALKGLKEVTTDAGRQRLATEASKFLTRGDKWKQLAKTTGSQMWGGAWTNGTDDMMTDAAERMSSDSFDRYINGYLDDEAIADNAIYADGIYTFMRNLSSYGKGLSNSLGQETTWNAAKVGAFGSALSGNINFVNLGRLVTKSGREAYRRNFQERYQRDENGIIQRDEKGNPLTEKIGWRENWRDRAAYFIQNGILNTYYGKKQTERDLQSHADFVNNLLDDADDFRDIQELLASDKGLDDAVGTNDKKTMRFIKALKTARTLANLGNNSSDPANMSSVVQNAKALIEQASQMNFDPERENLPEDEFSKSLVAQYFAHNNDKDHPRNLYTERQALATVIKNAKEFKEASEAYDAAEAEIQKAEKSRGEEFSPVVRERLKLNHALNGHWQQRLDQMKDEIGDTSEAGEIAEENIIPSLGSMENAQDLVKAYNRQEKELVKQVSSQEEKVNKAKTTLDEAQTALTKNTDGNVTHELEQKAVEANSKYESERLQLGYLREALATTRSKRNKVENALKSTEEEDYKDKVLTANEIMSLDPVSRARMLRNDDVFITDEEKKEGVRSWREKMYSPEQIAEIEKLERQLTMRDADALQKVQDIALLTNRIETNKDAYNKVMQNPEAAAMAFEAQQNAAAERGYAIINHRNAKIIADIINNAENNTEGYKDLSQGEKDTSIYNTLRELNPNVLNIIDSDNLLPQYQKQVNDAKDWQKVVEDLDAVISNADKDDAWKQNIRGYVNAAERVSSNRDNLLAVLERSIDNGENSDAVRNDLDYILQGMEELGYHRDSTVLENRAKRKEREKKENKARAEREAKEKALKEKVKKAAEEEAAKKGEIVADGEGDKVDLGFGEEEKSEGTSNAPLTRTVQGKKKSYTYTVTGTQEKRDERNGLTTVTFQQKRTNNDTGEERTLENGIIEIPYDDFDIDSYAIQGSRHADTGEPLKKEELTDEDREEARKNLENLSYNPLTDKTRENGLNVEGIIFTDDGRAFAKVKEGSISQNIELTSEAAKKYSDLLLKKSAEDNISDVSTDNKNLVEDGDNIVGKSESVEEQIKDAEKAGERQYSQDENVDSEKVNEIIETSMENNETSLTANSMNPWVVFDPKKPNAPSLRKGGILVHKKGEKERDSMNRYYAWMDNADIHLQEIIDTELSKILEQNPHTKIKFMYVNPSGKGTDDRAMRTHLMLVVDYDNSINKGITSIHNDKNGGVITANGKQYLIVGVAGYGNSMAKRDLYDILMSNDPNSPHGNGVIRTESNKYFTSHPEERFYVNENLSTEVVPMSLIPGYIVRQLETDSNAEYRDISKILADKARNPEGLKLEDLAWGIQEELKFLVVNNKDNKRVMVPQDSDSNKGRAFVLLPASNGALVPSYLKPLFYADAESNGSVMREGKLKDKVYEYLNQLTSQDHQTRVNGIIGLSQIFYFDNENGDGILTTRDTSKAPIVSLLHNGEVFKSFNLTDPKFDRQKLFEALEQMNPRINITYQVLKNPERLALFDEAGALQTDAALLHTVGASYSIYALDADGNMLGQGKTPENFIQTAPANDDFRRDSRQVVFNRNFYNYTNGKYYLNGKEVTDAKTIKQLDYNRRIFVEQQLEPSVSEGVWNTFILSKGEHPEVVKVNKNTYKVKELSEKEAKALIEKLDKKNDDKERQNAAEDAIKIDEGENVNLGEDVEGNPTASEDNGEMEADPDTGEVVPRNAAKPVQVEKKEKTSANKDRYNKGGRTDADNMTKAVFDYLNDDISETEFKARVPEAWYDDYKSKDAAAITKAYNNGIIGSTEKAPIQKEKKNTLSRPAAPSSNTSPTQTFKKLYSSPKHKLKLLKLLKNKWKDVPKDIDKLTEYLRKKNIEVDAIGTSEDDINAWIKTIEDCR